MANKNKMLAEAKKAKKDEFYTQLSDIDRELGHYSAHFHDKIVLCNCDDPYESNFFKYFALNFNFLGLKKLICTCYNGSPVEGTQLNLFDAEPKAKPKHPAYKVEISEIKDYNNDGTEDLADVEYLLKNNKNTISELKTGDFRSEECIELLKQADVVVTNPPFSLFREYVAQLVKYGKKFLIIGHQNDVTMKDIFKLIQADKVWWGYGFKGAAAHFITPYEDTAKSGDHKKGMVRVSGVTWYTNLEIKKHHEHLLDELVRKYDPEYYPKFDNYDAINVGKTLDIPYDYDGVMGVPITFLDKYNPDEFEIVGLTQLGCHDGFPDTKKYNDYKEMLRLTNEPTGAAGGKTNENAVLQGRGKKKTYYLGPNGEIVHSEYKRLFIRNKHPRK